MNVKTVSIAGMEFVDISTLPKGEIKFIERMPYNHSTYLSDGTFTKVYDWKCRMVSSRAGWLLVKTDDARKYYDLEGCLEDHMEEKCV